MQQLILEVAAPAATWVDRRLLTRGRRIEARTRALPIGHLGLWREDGPRLARLL